MTLPRAPVGAAEGGIFLHEQHVTALLPLDPTQDPGTCFAALSHRLAERGALLPPLATLPPSFLAERIETDRRDRGLGARDLIPCPYCFAAKKKGTRADAPRIRIPAGIGSQLAAWGAELAAARGELARLVHICMYMCMCMRMCMRMCMCMCMCMLCVCMLYVHIRKHAHTSKHAHTHTTTQTHRHRDTCVHI